MAGKHFVNNLTEKFTKLNNRLVDFLKASFRGFDEAGYLAVNPDVAKAVKEGKFSSGKEHYRKFGKREGRITRFNGKNALIPVSEQIVPLYMISGHTLQNGIPIVIAYCGHDQLKLVQWASLIMNSPGKLHIGDFPLAGLINYVKKLYPTCSMILFEKDLPGELGGIIGKGFSLPYFMQTFIDISCPIEKLFHKYKSGFANAGKLIRKNHLTYGKVNSYDDQQDFYHNMYLPYLRGRHGEVFQEVTFQNVFSKEIPFEIIQILKDNEVVAGTVVRFKKNGVYASFLGIKNGVFDHVKKGAIGAIYYFLCDELHNRGYKKFYIGGSPPFVSNQLTAYKIRMTAQIDKDYHYENHELVSMYLLNDSAATRDFLSYSPFVYINNSGANVGTVWVDNYQKPSAEEVKNEILRIFRLGLDECQIIYWGKKPKIYPVSKEHKNKTIRFVSARKYFDSKLKLKI